MNARTFLVGTTIAAGLLLGAAREARAQLIIKNPTDHPDYRAELEPHLDAIFWHGGWGRGAGYHGFGDPEFGGGFRATIEVADPVIRTLNNTIGITFGVDVTNYRGCKSCDFSIWTPVGAQWNFFLTKQWSVFGEAGFVLSSRDFYDALDADLMLMVGGRYHFTDKISLTMRLGYPFVSVGASFFVG